MTKPIHMKAGIVAHLPLDLVRPDPFQPRKDFTEADLVELAANIKARGVQQPITVRADSADSGLYIIKTGERRWRASRLAGKKTVPALLDIETTDSALQVAFDQVAENHHRADLNPMEYAEFLCRLRDEFGMTVRDIEAKLAQQGVHNMQRSYLSNIMRMTKLPAWAQERIRKGQMTAAHGKHLLAAIDSPKVMEALRSRLACGAIVPTTREIQEAVYEHFEDEHTELTEHSARFDLATCKGCAKRKKIANPYYKGESDTFCLDASCYAEKQEAARETPLITAKGKAGKAGYVDLICFSYNRDYLPLRDPPFDIETCKGCPNKKKAGYSKSDAVDTCFDITCYKKKAGEASRVAGRRDRIQGHVEAWLRERLVMEIDLSDPLEIMLIHYLALHTPGNRVYGSSWNQDSAREGDRAAERLGIKNLDALFETAYNDKALRLIRNQIALASLAALSRRNIVALAKHRGIDVREFRVDAEYLKIPRRDELKQLIERAGLTYDGSDKLAAIQAFCLEHADQIDVPPDVQAFYETGDVSQELDDDEDEDDQRDLINDDEEATA